MVLAAGEVRSAAHACGFTLVGLAPAEPLDATPLRRWIELGYAAGLTAMRRRLDERTNPAAVVPGAKTVIVLGIPYDRGPAGAIARYARGRDYHYAHRDRMRALRHRLCALDASVRTYACVDAGAAMEKAWAERAGLGFIGKNGLLITREHGSWLTLSLTILDREMDSYDQPQARRCGDCRKCLDACPTAAFPSPGVVDARRACPIRPSRTTSRFPSSCTRVSATKSSAATCARKSAHSTKATCRPAIHAKSHVRSARCAHSKSRGCRKPSSTSSPAAPPCAASATTDSDGMRVSLWARLVSEKRQRCWNA